MKIPHRFVQSLRFKLVACSVLIQIVFIALLVTHSVNLVDESQIKQAEIRLFELEQLLNASIATRVVQQDIEMLQEILDESAREDGINYFLLMGLNKKVIVQSGEINEHTLEESEFDSLAQAIKLGKDVFHTHTDISIADIKYARLHYGVSIKSLVEMKLALIKGSVLIAIVGIILSGLALYLIGIWLTRHLSQLTEVSQSFAAGDLRVRANVKSTDEIQYLAQAFNAMAESLDTRIKDLKASQIKQKELLIVSQQEKARLTSLLEVMTRGILFETLSEDVAYCNPAFSKMWGMYEPSELIGKPMIEVQKIIDVQLSAQPEKKSLLTKYELNNNGKGVEFELMNGAMVIQRYYPVFDDEKNILGTLWIFEDVTVERQTAEQLIHLAEHDFLTGLYNRRKFEDEVGRQIDMCRRQNAQLALVFFDIDDFKYINDAFGHKYGDEVLSKMACDIGILTRKGELFCRLGGDEFAIIMPGASVASAKLFAERVRSAVTNISFQQKGKRIVVTSSIGISLFPKHAVDLDELLICADMAMYQAKAAGKNTWKVYEESEASSQDLLKKINWDGQISDAMDNDLLALSYQGIYDVKTHKLFYLEALIRMKVAGESRVILPGQFIPFAERSGKILEIDRWVVREVVNTLAKNKSISCIAVNISGRSFDDQTLARYIIQTMEENNVEPHRLMLELTETAAVSDLHDAQRFISLVKQFGCKVAIDDFGSGYASFVYLKHLDADVVKIDGLFTHDLVNEKDNQLFIQAIVDIARGLGKKTVAEFVEEEESLAILSAIGVDYVQGFYFNKPAKDFSKIDIQEKRQNVETFPIL